MSDLERLRLLRRQASDQARPVRPALHTHGAAYRWLMRDLRAQRDRIETLIGHAECRTNGRPHAIGDAT